MITHNQIYLKTTGTGIKRVTIYLQWVGDIHKWVKVIDQQVAVILLRVGDDRKWVVAIRQWVEDTRRHRTVDPVKDHVAVADQCVVVAPTG